MKQSPDSCSFTWTFAVLELEIVATVFIGKKPAVLMRSSWFASAQTLRAFKKPLSSVLAGTLQGLSEKATLAPAMGAFFVVWTQPVSTWSSHRQASHAAFRVPLRQFFLQSWWSRTWWNHFIGSQFRVKRPKLYCRPPFAPTPPSYSCHLRSRYV